MSKRTKIMSYISLSISVVVFIAMSSLFRTLYGDNASSLFKLMLSARSMDEACLLVSPISMNCNYLVKLYWFTSITANVLIDLLPYISGVLVLILTYIYAQVLFRDALIAGLSVLLMAITPGFIYYFRPGNEGPYLIGVPLLLAFNLAVTVIYGSGKRVGLVIAMILTLMASLYYEAGWMIPLCFSIVILISYVKRGLNKYMEYCGLGIVAMSLIPMLFYGVEYLTPFLIASIIATISIIIFNRISMSRDISLSYRLTHGLVIGLITISSALLWCNIQRGSFVPSLKQYDPLFDYGISGVLGIAGLTIFTRYRRVEKTWENILGIFYLSFMMSSIILGILERSLIAYTSSLLSILAGFTGVHLARTMYIHSDVFGKKRLYSFLSRSIAVLLIPCLLVANVVASTSIPGRDVVTPLTEFSGFNNIGNFVFNKQDWINAVSGMARSIAEDGGNDALLIYYWGHGFWIQELISRQGIKTYSLSNALSDYYDKSLVSRILLSEETTAVNILKNLTGEIRAKNVYVLIMFAASISTTIRVVGGGFAGDIYIGVPTSYEVVGGYYPQIIFKPAGDHSRLPLYAEMSGLDISNFITQVGPIQDTSMYLAWNTKGRRTLLVQITIDALNYLNYSVYNTQVSQSTLRSELKSFKPIYVATIPMYDVSIWYASYEVVYVIAVYKLVV